MTFVDHLMMLALAVALPIHSARAYRRYLDRIEAGHPPDRRKQYRNVHVLEWVSFAVLVAVWIFYERPYQLLGFVEPGGPGFWIGLLLLSVFVSYLVYSWHSASRADVEQRENIAASLGELVHLAPNTRSTFRLFCGVSVTAGIVEETVYRGFAFWYLAGTLPMWAVVIVSSIMFGLGHTYQGLGGVLRITGVGACFGLFYWLTGSIWLPIIAHALLDILQGAMIYETLRDRDGSTSTTRQETPITG